MPPLEALYLGTEPIISSIEVFKEIYSSFPVKFYSSLDELKKKIMEEPDKISSSIKEEILDKFSFERFSTSIITYIENDFKKQK